MELKADKKYGALSGEAISNFLKTAIIPMRLSLVSPKGPMIVALWFQFSGQEIRCCSPKDSLVVRSLQTISEIAFDISSNEIPYVGVRGRGKAELTQLGAAEQLDKLIEKYVYDPNHPLPARYGCVVEPGRYLLPRSDHQGEGGNNGTTQSYGG